MKNERLKKVLAGAFSPKAITLYIIVAIYAVTAGLLYSGAASRQFSNMLISVSSYVVLAISLNLVVGFLGELSLGHAGFMSVGCFPGVCFPSQRRTRSR